MTKIKLLFPCIIFILSSCVSSSNEKDLLAYVNGRQVLNLNALTRSGKPLQGRNIERMVPDTISAGSSFLAKIFLADDSYNLVDAFVGCTAVENPTVDTVISTAHKRQRLDGCTKGLFVANDTIYISFTPHEPGPNTFEEITVLTRDRDQVFRTHKYTFNYFVKEK